MSVIQPGSIAAPFYAVHDLLTKHRQLTVELSRRELTERYSGQFFGRFWIFAHPLFLIGLYVFVFSVVFRLRSGGGLNNHGVDYTLYLLAGLIPWMAFQEVMGKACYAITGNASLVKQVVFPIEVLPFKALVTAIINQLIASSIMFVYIIYTDYPLRLTVILFPVLFALQVIAMLGFSYGLAALSVFIRDTKDFIQIFLTAGLYLAPIFYLPQWIPALFKPILFFNPFSHMIWCYQDILVYGSFQHPVSWGVFTVFSLLSFIIGFRIFKSLKHMFGDSL